MSRFKIDADKFRFAVFLVLEMEKYQAEVDSHEYQYSYPPHVLEHKDNLDKQLSEALEDMITEVAEIVVEKTSAEHLTESKTLWEKIRESGHNS